MVYVLVFSIPGRSRFSTVEMMADRPTKADLHVLCRLDYQFTCMRRIAHEGTSKTLTSMSLKDGLVIQNTPRIGGKYSTHSHMATAIVLERSESLSTTYKFTLMIMASCSVGTLESRLVLARIIWNFNIELSEETDPAWLDQEAFVTWDRKPLIVKLHPKAQDA